jgi:hypothetical protein
MVRANYQKQTLQKNVPFDEYTRKIRALAPHRFHSIAAALSIASFLVAFW